MTVIKGALDSISLNVSLVDYVWFLPWILDVIKKKQEQKKKNKKTIKQEPYRYRQRFGHNHQSPDGETLLVALNIQYKHQYLKRNWQYD